MLNRTRILIDIFLRKEQSEDPDNIAHKIMNKLQLMGLNSIAFQKGTNHIMMALYAKIGLSQKIKKIDKIKEIEYFILWTYPQQEISDAITEHDYFKAFALCSTVYDSLGKGILFKHTNKNNIPINHKMIEGLKVNGIIKKLFDYNLIDEKLKSDMKKVNKIRHDFIHYNLSQVIRREQLKEIYENIDKINTSLDALQKKYDDLK